MIVIETCPQCGGELDILSLTTNPPIPARRCRRCGWYWQGKMSEIVRVPFQPPKDDNSITVYTTDGNSSDITIGAKEEA